MIRFLSGCGKECFLNSTHFNQLAKNLAAGSFIAVINPWLESYPEIIEQVFQSQEGALRSRAFSERQNIMYQAVKNGHYYFEMPKMWKENGYALALNTLGVNSNHAVKLMLRIQVMAERNGYFPGASRERVARIIELGLKTGLFREQDGWRKLVYFFQSEYLYPVVMDVDYITGRAFDRDFSTVSGLDFNVHLCQKLKTLTGALRFSEEALLYHGYGSGRSAYNLVEDLATVYPEEAALMS